MKKTFKLSIAIAFVLILIAPIIISGCIFGNKASLDLKTSFKTEYYVGEQLDVTGGSLLYKDANGNETEVALLSTMVSGFESDEVGTFELTITYKDATLKLNYKIKNYLSNMVGYYCKALGLHDNYVVKITENSFVWGIIYEGDIIPEEKEYIDMKLTIFCGDKEGERESGYLVKTDIADITFISSTEFTFIAPIYYEPNQSTIDATFTVVYSNNQITISYYHPLLSDSFILQKSF